MKRTPAAAMALTMTALWGEDGSSSGSTSTTAAADTTAAAVTEKAADGSSAEGRQQSVSIDRAKEFVTVATGPSRVVSTTRSAAHLQPHLGKCRI